MNNATIRVNFGTASGLPGAYLNAEVDSRSGGLNNGKTSFLPGDTVWILVYKSPNVGIQSVLASAGSVIQGAPQLVTKTVELSFENTNRASLPMPVESVLSSAWLGRDLGGLTLGDDRLTLIAELSGVALLSVEYAVLAHPYALASPVQLNGQSNFSVLLLVQGEAA